MWKEEVKKEANEDELQKHILELDDRVSPVWEIHHPVWVFLVLTLQTLLLCVALYFCLLPTTQFQQLEAVRNVRV